MTGPDVGVARIVNVFASATVTTIEYIVVVGTQTFAVTAPVSPPLM